MVNQSSNIWLLAAVVVALGVGSMVTPVLQSYHGIVLSADPPEQPRRVFLAFSERPPMWYSGAWVRQQQPQPGQIVHKERGSWTPQVQPARDIDFKLVQMQQRYSSAYDALIVRIVTPRAPHQAAVAVAETTQQKQVMVPLWAPELAGAAVGRRLRKLAGSWDPVLYDAPASVGVAPAVPPLNAPAAP